MKITYKKNKNHFIFFKNQEQIFSPGKNPLIVYKLKHVKIIIKELRKKTDSIDPYSVLGLSFFSNELDNSKKDEIYRIILKNLIFDITLFRCFEDQNLIKLMNKKYNDYIHIFCKKFQIKLELRHNFLLKGNIKVNEKKFRDFFNSLNNFYITVFLKLTGITKSVILSYFFLCGDIRCVGLFNLINIENRFQQKKWGYVDEQKKIDKDCLNTLKKIEIFFKNIN